MKELLPPSADLRLSQGPTKVTRAELARLDQAVIVLPAKPADADWRGVPGGAQLRAASRRAGAGTAVHSRLANPRGTGLSAQALPGGELDSFRLLQFAGKLVADAQQIVRGLQPQQLRDNQGLRQHVATELSGVQSILDGLLVDRPRRRILRKAR